MLFRSNVTSIRYRAWGNDLPVSYFACFQLGVDLAGKERNHQRSHGEDKRHYQQDSEDYKTPSLPFALRGNAGFSHLFITALLLGAFGRFDLLENHRRDP